MPAFADLPPAAHRLIDRYLGAAACALAHDLARSRCHSEIGAALDLDARGDIGIKVVAGFLLVHCCGQLNVYSVGTEIRRVTRRQCSAPMRYWNRYILADELLHLDQMGQLHRVASPVIRRETYDAAALDYTRMLPGGELYGSPNGARPVSIHSGQAVRIAANPALIYDERGRPALGWADKIGPGNCLPWTITEERPHVMPTPRGGLLYYYPQRYMIG